MVRPASLKNLTELDSLYFGSESGGNSKLTGEVSGVEKLIYLNIRTFDPLSPGSLPGRAAVQEAIEAIILIFHFRSNRKEER